ncbi:long-chain fatty acid-CoA ligase [Rhizophlyctis rosea]|nr:long-chain fatty acid-CoA ligase [Rhizophlyctis rosea]
MPKTQAQFVGEPTATESPVIRNVDALKGDLLNNINGNIFTMYELFNHVAETYPTVNSFGSRTVVREIEEEKEIIKVIGGQETKEIKKWKFFELSGYEWLTYAEAKQWTIDIGAGLRKIGLKEQDKLTIFAATSRNWLLTAHACFTQNMTITTAYDTLGQEGLTYSLNECEVSTVFTNDGLLSMIQKITKDVPTLKRVIYDGKADQAVIDKLKSSHGHLEFYTLDEIRQLGKENPVPEVKPKAEDLCCIMYTSGSTGNPKGVMLTHSNVVASVAGARHIIKTIAKPNDVYLAYLPLAHILEFVAQNVVLSLGMQIGYGNPRTLSDTSVRNCRGDLTECRPSIMTGVPAVWETIRKGVYSKLKEKGPTAKTIFESALAAKWQLMKLGLPTGFIDPIFAQIKANTGGRLRYVLSGGAPISPETQQFLTTAVCPVIQGYGMTEGTAVIAIQLPQDPTTLGRTGPPAVHTELKLVAVPETDYHPSNTPHPRGELWVRGPNVMKGYYKQDQLTKEAMTPDGWLMTGDIAEKYPDGTIQIIDRKKNLVKLSNGEYIALEKLEAGYKTNKYVFHICVYADSNEAFPIAVVVPIEKELVEFGKSIGLSGNDLEMHALVNNKAVQKEVLGDLRESARKLGFKGADVLGAIYLTDEEWTPQNDMLTAAQKLKRNDINKHYKQQLHDTYKGGRQ